MSLDQLRNTQKNPVLGDAGALCTMEERAELEKIQQRRGRILHVPSQKFLLYFWMGCDPALMWFWFFLIPEIVEPFVPRQIWGFAQMFSSGSFPSLVHAVTSVLLVPSTQAEPCTSTWNIFKYGNNKCIVHHPDVNLGLFSLVHHLAVVVPQGPPFPTDLGLFNPEEGKTREWMAQTGKQQRNWVLFTLLCLFPAKNLKPSPWHVWQVSPVLCSRKMARAWPALAIPMGLNCSQLPKQWGSTQNVHWEWSVANPELAPGIWWTCWLSWGCANPSGTWHGLNWSVGAP